MSSRPWSEEQLSTRADSSVILCRAMLVPSLEPRRPGPRRGRMLGTRRHHPHIPTGQRDGPTCLLSPRPRRDGLYGCSNGACETSWRGDSHVLRVKCLPPSEPLTASSPLLRSKPAVGSPSPSGLLLSALGFRQLFCWIT